MKYMTFDLLARTQSQDEKIAEEAMVEWEQACDRYNEHLKTLVFPETIVQGLLTGPALHDARVVNIGGDNDEERGNYLFIEVQLDSPNKQGLRLVYKKLFDQPKVHFNKENLRPNMEMLWLYDEVDSETDRSGNKVFKHSILCSEGLEIEISFSGFDYKLYKSLLDPVRRPRSKGRSYDLAITP